MIQRLRENAARPLPCLRQDALLVNRRPWPLQIGPHLLPPEIPTEVTREWVQTPGVAAMLQQGAGPSNASNAPFAITPKR
jgi:hypothetical protein